MTSTKPLFLINNITTTARNTTTRSKINSVYNIIINNGKHAGEYNI